MQDRRVEELRDLVSSAVEGDVVFDEKFAKDTLKGVIAQQGRSDRWRLVTAFITKPLGKVPLLGPLLEPAADLAVKKIYDRRKAGLRWYYMLSEAAAKPQV